MLVLGIAEPTYSKKYEATICVAGLTTKGRFRRIYPIPLKNYFLHRFKKYQYISYNAQAKGDCRPESRKIDPASIELFQMASPATVSQKIREHQAASHEYLRKRRKISLGIIKPEIESFQTEHRRYRRTIKYSKARGSMETLSLIPYWVKFHFSCRPSCPCHQVICEDMEVGNYFRRLLLNAPSNETSDRVVKRMGNYLAKTTPYFLMGTMHGCYKAWIIISLINPQAEHFYSGICLE